MAEIGEIVGIFGTVVASGKEPRPCGRGDRCCSIHAMRVDLRLEMSPPFTGLDSGGSGELGLGPPVRRAVEGVASSSKQMVAVPVGGIGKAPVGVLMPLLLNGM